jgi:hypothetical protein
MRNVNTIMKNWKLSTSLLFVLFLLLKSEDPFALTEREQALKIIADLECRNQYLMNQIDVNSKLSDLKTSMVTKEDLAILIGSITTTKEDLAILIGSITTTREDLAIVRGSITTTREDLAILRGSIMSLQELMESKFSALGNQLQPLFVIYQMRVIILATVMGVLTGPFTQLWNYREYV